MNRYSYIYPTKPAFANSSSTLAKISQLENKLSKLECIYLPKLQRIKERTRNAKRKCRCKSLPDILARTNSTNGADELECKYNERKLRYENKILKAKLRKCTNHGITEDKNNEVNIKDIENIITKRLKPVEDRQKQFMSVIQRLLINEYNYNKDKNKRNELQVQNVCVNEIKGTGRIRRFDVDNIIKAEVAEDEVRRKIIDDGNKKEMMLKSMLRKERELRYKEEIMRCSNERRIAELENEERKMKELQERMQKHLDNYEINKVTFGDNERNVKKRKNKKTQNKL